jgi:hypothetical protein
VDALALWDAGSGLDEVGRALLLARAASGPDEPDPAGATIGARDAMLLDLRAAVFGTWVEAVATCPGCGETLELRFPLDRIRAPSIERADGPIAIRDGEFELTARLPTSRDLTALAGCHDVSSARAQLLEQCLIRATRGTDEVEARDLPESAVRALGEALGTADPQADVELGLVCAGCGHHWNAQLDIASFLWTEIEHHALSVMHDVHALARCYGWSEAQILELSPQRRRRYLALIADG